MRKNAPPGRNWIAPFCGGSFNSSKQRKGDCGVFGAMMRCLALQMTHTSENAGNDNDTVVKGNNRRT